MSSAETSTAHARGPIGRWDGDIVVTGTHGSAPERHSRTGGTPLVTVGHPATSRPTTSVLIDTWPAAHDLARRTARRGHRRVAVIGVTAGSWVQEEYARALHGTLLQAGYTAGAIDTVTTEASVAAGHAAAAQILQRPLGIHLAPTAFLCVDDTIARGVIELCRERGLHVPADIAVAGFGDSIESRVLVPALTTVRLPADRLGCVALDALLTRIDSPAAPASVRTVPASVTERGSLTSTG